MRQARQGEGVAPSVNLAAYYLKCHCPSTEKAGYCSECFFHITTNREFPRMDEQPLGSRPSKGDRHEMYRYYSPVFAFPDWLKNTWCLACDILVVKEYSKLDDPETFLPIQFPAGWFYRRPVIDKVMFEEQANCFQEMLLVHYHERDALTELMEAVEVSPFARGNDQFPDFDCQDEVYAQERRQKIISMHNQLLEDCILAKKLIVANFPEWATDYKAQVPLPPPNFKPSHMRSVSQLLALVVTNGDKPIKTYWASDGDDYEYNDIDWELY